MSSGTKLTPPKNLNDNIKGILLAITAFSLFAISDALCKYLTSYYSVIAISFYVAISVIFCLLLAAPKLGGVKKTFKTRNMKLHLLRGFILFVQFACIMYGFSQLSMAETYALIFTAPFIMTILSIPLLKEKVTGTQWLAIALGFCGVLIILRPGMVPIDLAALAVLGSALLFSLYNIIARFMRDSDETLLSWALLPELPFLLCASVAVSFMFVVPTPIHMLIFLVSGALACVAIICMAQAFVHAPPAIAAPFHYTQMIWAIGLGYLFFGDVIDIWVGIGSVIIIISGLWLIRNNSTAARETPPVP